MSGRVRSAKMQKSEYALVPSRGRIPISDRTRRRVDMAIRVVEARGIYAGQRQVRECLVELTGAGADNWAISTIIADHIRHHRKRFEGIVRQYRRLDRTDRRIVRSLISAAERSLVT